MKIIKYEGFKDVFIGLIKEEDNNNYYLIYGKTASAFLNTETEYQNIIGQYNKKLFQVVKGTNYEIRIPFSPNKESMIHYISIAGENEYNKIVSIMRDLI